MKKTFAFFFLLVMIGCRKMPPTTPGPPAHGYFPTDKYGACGGGTIAHGIWYNGLPAGTDTNYVNVSVYVTSPGSYKITTDTVDGVYFTGMGEFPDSGTAMAQLKATGSFKTPGDVTFHIRFDSSDCQYMIAVNDSAGLSIGANMWTFTAEGHTYSGPFTASAYDIPESSNDIFELDGYTTGHPDSALFIGFGGTNVWPLDTGYHRTTDFGAVVEFHIITPGVGGNLKTIYLADNSTAPGAVITVHVQSRVEMLVPFYQIVNVATFNGTAVDSAGKVVNITNAKFKWVSS
jgi:hypothetical protein